jgi:hypothetical protein
MFDNGLQNFIQKVVTQQNKAMVDTLLSSAGIKDENRKAQIHQLADNTRKFLVENATDSGNVVSFIPAYIPMLTRLMPSIITLELVGVQPLNAPVGIVWAYRMYLAGKNSKYANGVLTANFYSGVIAIMKDADLSQLAKSNALGQTLYEIFDLNTTTVLARCYLLHKEEENANAFLNILEYDAQSTLWIKPKSATTIEAINSACDLGHTVQIRLQSNSEVKHQIVTTHRNWDKDYLFGSIFKFFSGGDSTDAPSYLEGYEGLDDTNGIKFHVESKDVKAKTRKLRVDFTMEALQDTQALYKGYDLQAEMIKMAVRQLALEIDQEILFYIKKLAGQNDIFEFDFATVNGFDIAGKVKTLLVMIEDVATQIAQDTRLGAGNFIITNSRGVALLNTLPQFNRTQDYETLGSAVQKAGTLNGVVKVFLDPFSKEDAIYIGHKGATEGSTGLIFSPYIPIQVKTITDTDTFNTNNLVFTRYAITDSIYGSKKFYRKITMKNFAF